VPWKVICSVDLKAEFVVRHQRGESIAELCREYGISRKTGHKVISRFEALGTAGLFDLSRAPKSIPHKTPPEVVELVLKVKRDHPFWGAKKIKGALETQLGRAFPAASTLADILSRHGLVERRGRRPRRGAAPTGLRAAEAPNDVWCVDYKGQFRLGDRSYCYPLTMTDQFSRFVLMCEGMDAIDAARAREASALAFQSHGLPLRIHSDNGAPFASTGVLGLTALSVYWLRLGIELERSRPAHPEDNGRHERMHRTLKRETTRPARHNLLQQQERFDAFVHEFNSERPHEALGMKRPAEVYTPSPRTLLTALPELTYPLHDDVKRISHRGDINAIGRSVYIGIALAGEDVGLREEDDGRLLVTFMDMDLGHVDGHKLQPLPPPGHY